MSKTPPAVRDFARRFIAHEVARGQLPGVSRDGAARVCDRLRKSLVRLVGVAGFRALMSRALALAKSEVPSLAAVQVLPDGTLEGLDVLQHEDAGADGGAGVVIVAHQLQLLVTFIGEPLMLGLVRDAWPDAPGLDAGSGGQP